MLPPLGAALLIGYLSSIGPWLQGQGGRGVALYVAGFALFGGFALLPTYAPAILGGWAFGDRLGIPAALAGFVCASAINYAWAHRLSGTHAAAVLAERPRWLAVRNALVGRSWWKTVLVVALIRVPPNSPFALGNGAMAAARVPIGAYLVGTLFGLAPRTAVAVKAGAHLSTLDFGQRDALGSAGDHARPLDRGAGYPRMVRAPRPGLGAGGGGTADRHRTVDRPALIAGQPRPIQLYDRPRALRLSPPVHVRARCLCRRLPDAAPVERVRVPTRRHARRRPRCRKRRPSTSRCST